VETGRWSTIDPMAESYTSMSPFNYVANNPISNIDPDGKRFKVSIKNEGNGNISINISSTIYIQTDNPSEWELITKDAREYFSEVFKENQSSDGKISITFDVDFKAVSSIELGEADNLLEYKPNKKSRVKPSESDDRNAVGIIGVLGDKDYRTIVHETGHFLGLVDRYTNVKGKGSVTHEGWKGNLMSADKGPNLFQSQYDNFVRHLVEHYNKTKESNFIYSKYVELKGGFIYPRSKIKKNE